MPAAPPPPPDSAVTRTLAGDRLGVGPVVFMVLAAAAPLTVVAGGATTGWAVTGVTGIPAAYLAVAVILAVFSVGYVAMSRRVVNAGAFYTYITHGLGRPLGVAASNVAVLAYATLYWGLIGGFGVVLAGWLDTRFGINLPWWLLAFAALGAAAVLGVRKIDLNSRILATLLCGEFIVAVIFGFVAVAHPAGGTVSFATLSPGNLVGSGAGAAFAIAIAGFVGFEGTAVYSEESRDPQRTVPRATYIAVAVIGVLYGFCAWSMSVATGPDRIVEQARAQSTELLFNIAGPYVGQSLVDLGHLLFVSSLFAAVLAFHNTGSRYLFALGREQVMPRAFGTTSISTKAPKVASLVQSAAAAVVVGVYAFAGWDPLTKLFFWQTVLGGLGVLILMAVIAIAVLRFFRTPAHRAGVSGWASVVAPVLAACALLWICWVTLSTFDVLLGVDADSALRWMLPSAFLVVAVAGLGRALWLKTYRPDVYAGIGRGAQSILTPLTTSTSGSLVEGTR